ncbi:hypothetical protein IAU60_000089 [Kwoniella sp. DSM 27419]
MSSSGGLQRHPTVALKEHRSAHPFFTPTHLSFVEPKTGASAGSWSSRRARKGRYAPKGAHVHYAAGGGADTSVAAEKGQGEVKRMEQLAYGRLKREETKFKPGLHADISFWLAVTFVTGSIFWVINGYLVWFPDLRPNLETDAFKRTAAATAFIGASTFELGSYLMVVEALDRGRETNFGTALGQLLHHRRGVAADATIAMDDIKHDISHISSHTTLTGEHERIKAVKQHHTDEAAWPSGAKGFVWWGKPMWHDLGYLAAIIQLLAATIFWVPTLTGLPGVIPGFFAGGGSVAIIDVFYWTPQVIGGTGFVISSGILMIEVQKKWWLPNITEIGWWIGLWNLIGSVGFALCGALGYSPSSGAVYQSGLSTFWGSWAFLIGSGCQLYEVIWREPAPEPEQNGKDN